MPKGILVVPPKLGFVYVYLHNPLTLQYLWSLNSSAYGENDIMIRHAIMIWIDAAWHSQRQVVPVRDRAFGPPLSRLRALAGYSASASKASFAPDRLTPPPAYISGFLALATNSRALLDAVCACGLALVVDGFEQLDFCYIGERLRRYLNLHRARPARLELVKRLMHRFGHITRIKDALRPLGNWANRVELIVDFVQHAAVTPNHVALHLPCHHHDRRGCCVCRADCRRCVLQARPRYHERSAYVVPRTRVTVRHVRSCLLVPRGDELDTRLLCKSVKSVIELDSRKPEYHPHAFTI